MRDVILEADVLVVFNAGAVSYRTPPLGLWQPLQHQRTKLPFVAFGEMQRQLVIPGRRCGRSPLAYAIVFG